MKTKDDLNVLLILALYGLTCCLVREHTYVNQIMTWPEAQQHCRLYYDDLSTLPTLDEIMEIVVKGGLICPSNSGYYLMCLWGKWIGLYTATANLSTPVWIWSGGQNETLCTWASGEPNNIPTQACGLLVNTIGQCYNAPCSWNLSFFCMDVYEVVLVQKSMTWQKALDYCRKHYIDLVSLKAKKWMTDAVNVTKAAQTAHVWTGLRFLYGHWFWSTGDPLVYQAWSTEGQLQCPATNQRCGALGQQEQTWQPRDCEENLNFLCFQRSKYPRSPSTSVTNLIIKHNTNNSKDN